MAARPFRVWVGVAFLLQGAVSETGSKGNTRYEDSARICYCVWIWLLDGFKLK